MSQPAIAATNRPKRSEDTLSLVELLDDAKVSVSGESMEDNSGPVTVFTSEQLEKVWNNYANSIREDKGPNIYNVLMGSVPRLEAGFEVKFALVNSVQERVMSGIRQELTEYLRRELHNVELSLSTYINQHEIVDRVGSYKTPEQILREMREKNPSLNSLVTFLRLDIEP
jgi:hypothetical protein